MDDGGADVNPGLMIVLRPDDPSDWDMAISGMGEGVGTGVGHVNWVNMLLDGRLIELESSLLNFED